MTANEASNGDKGRTPEGVFGKALKFFRERAGLSQVELAALSNYSNTVISKIENGDRPPAENFPERMDAIPQLETNGELTRLWGWLKDSVRHSAYPGWFDPWPEIEAKAAIIRTYEPLLVPGLLQTEDYARAILSVQPGITEDQLEKQVAARIARQSILDGADAPQVWCVLDEGVLHRMIGNRKTTHDTLMHLARMAEHPKVTVQVIPSSVGAHAGLLGAFAMADVDGHAWLYLETSAEGQISESPSMITLVAHRFDKLRSDAFPWTASRDLILKVAEDEWT